MDDAQRSLIARTVLDVTGVSINVITPKVKEIRSSLLAYIDGYSSQEGPIFAIKAHGLKSHQVTATMGTFSIPCIKQMQAATTEQLALARSLIRQLAAEPNTKVTINPQQTLEDWIVLDSGFSIEIITQVETDQYSEEAVASTASKFMAPMLASFAELIGYVDPDGEDNIADTDFAFDIEGHLTTALVKKRERSRRNRMLCMAIHGNRCFVCGKSPADDYPGLASIIEVHHIEPISTLLIPRVYDPRTDLIPLCPNCHRAIHQKIPAMMPEELRAIMKIPV
jgi:5-methylcytosine-specific restriction protein A